MKGPILASAVGAWALALAALAASGWAAALAAGSPVHGVLVVLLATMAAAGIFLGLWRRRAIGYDAALAATLAAAGLNPAAFDSTDDFVVLVVLAAVPLVAHAVLTLAIRIHAVHGPVLLHGMLRASFLVAAAAALAAAVMAVPAVTAPWVSERWVASLDASSTYALAAVGLVFLAVGTAVTLLRLARTIPSVAASSNANESRDSRSPSANPLQVE